MATSYRAWGGLDCNPLTPTPNHFDPLGRDRQKREQNTAVKLLDVRKPEGPMIVISTRTPV